MLELRKISKQIKNVSLEDFKNRKANKLFVTKEQRVAIARVLIKEPKIIFVDELII